MTVMTRHGSMAGALVGFLWLVACSDAGQGSSTSGFVQTNDACQTAFVLDPPVPSDEAIAAIRASGATPTEIRHKHGDRSGAMGGQDPMDVDDIGPGLETLKRFGPGPVEINGLRFQGIVDPLALGELASHISYRKVVPATSVLVYMSPDVAAEVGDEQITVVKAFNTCEH